MDEAPVDEAGDEAAATDEVIAHPSPRRHLKHLPLIRFGC